MGHEDIHETSKAVLPTGVGTPTYTTLKDFINTMMSGAIISGGVISDGGSGTIDITETEGLVKKTDSDTGEVIFFKLAAAVGFALTDNSLNWIYADYNGGTPIWGTAASLAAINHHTQIVVGRVYREGTELHILRVGSFFADYMMQHSLYEFEAYGFERASGLLISETGTRNIAITAGVIFASLNRLTTPGFDSSGADDFSYFYNDGAWQEVTTQSQIDNTQYNDFGTGLDTLTVQRYGVHWVYEELDGHVVIVYGTGDYMLAQAEAAIAPTSLPDRLANMGVLVGKIIIKNGDAVFTDVISAFTQVLTGAAIINHNDTGGLQGGTANEYYHLTAAELSALVSPEKSSSTGDSTTTAVTYQSKLQLTFIPPSIGDYSLEFYAEFANEEVKKVFATIDLDSGTILAEQIKDVSDIEANGAYEQFSGSVYVNLSAASHTFDLMWHGESVGKIAYIRRAYMIARRL